MLNQDNSCMKVFHSIVIRKQTPSKRCCIRSRIVCPILSTIHTPQIDLKKASGKAIFLAYPTRFSANFTHSGYFRLIRGCKTTLCMTSFCAKPFDVNFLDRSLTEHFLLKNLVIPKYLSGKNLFKNVTLQFKILFQ